ncbi:helix-turn-helix transcriptional regulator [Megalodesulfovibrio paquesii]
MPESTVNWKQACKILECSKSHFYNLVNAGELPAQRSGKVRGVRVLRSDCEKFLLRWRERLEGEDA